MFRLARTASEHHHYYAFCFSIHFIAYALQSINIIIHHHYPLCIMLACSPILRIPPRAHPRTNSEATQHYKQICIYRKKKTYGLEYLKHILDENNLQKQWKYVVELISYSISHKYILYTCPGSWIFILSNHFWAKTLSSIWW